MENNTNKRALLVMDLQAGIVGRFPAAADLVTHVTRAIAHARENNIPVIYVVVGFRPGMPDISPNNKGFTTSKKNLEGVNMDEFMKIHPGLAPVDGEITVIKRRVSAFAGSDLEVVLRSFGIQELVLTGIATSGVVLSTLREAADKDYSITLLTDGCADGDEEVHRVLITKVFPRMAEVMTIDEWIKM